MELNREADDEHLKTLEKAVKNKFRWHWLETTVEITLKGERKATSLIEWIRKLDVPGKAKCIVCDKIISYGARGRISLTEHCKSNEHAEKLKIKADNYTLGVPKANSKSYGIHPFFLLSRKDIQQPETVKRPLFLWIRELQMLRFVFYTEKPFFLQRSMFF